MNSRWVFRPWIERRAECCEVVGEWGGLDISEVEEFNGSFNSSEIGDCETFNEGENS